jgi:hypothetical protein
MGIEDSCRCVADSVESYARLAVAIARNEGGAGERARSMLQAQRHVLYEQPGVVDEWRQFIVDIVRRPRPPPKGLRLVGGGEEEDEEEDDEEEDEEEEDKAGEAGGAGGAGGADRVSGPNRAGDSSDHAPMGWEEDPFALAGMVDLTPLSGALCCRSVAHGSVCPWFPIDEALFGYHRTCL